MTASLSPQPLSTLAPARAHEGSSIVTICSSPDDVVAKNEQAANSVVINAAAKASHWSELSSLALGISPPKTDSESFQISKRDKLITIESAEFRRCLLQTAMFCKSEQIIDDLKEQVSKLTAEANDAAKLRAKNEELKALNRKRTSEWYDFEFAVKDTRDECVALKAQVTQLKNDRLRLNDQVMGLQVTKSGWRTRSDQHSSVSGQLSRALEVSNMLNRALLDENRTLSDDNRGLKYNMLSIDDAYHRLQQDHNMLENSLQSHKEVVNDLASKLVKLSEEKDEARQSKDKALKDLRLLQDVNHQHVVSRDLCVIVSQNEEEVVVLKKKLAISHEEMVEAHRERDSSSKQLSMVSRLFFVDGDVKRYSKVTQQRVNEETQLAVNWVCKNHGLPHEEYPQFPVSDNEKDEDCNANISLGEHIDDGESGPVDAGDVEKEKNRSQTGGGGIANKQSTEGADSLVQTI
ncbi:uncharacterized protein LOC113324154 [Papaver somniferum]|uniref:uncharacterized protein LOC113324154 n=1 Tax=Papaver somniferum TaxID=3469 RepID=UPI000E7026CC|nr:uncharacterized protein LOC113324154 [Papaver somniferum]